MRVCRAVRFTGMQAVSNGMVDRIREELCKMTGVEQEQVKVIATGGLARVIVPYCHNEIILDDKLLLKGLKIIYDKNVE